MRRTVWLLTAVVLAAVSAPVDVARAAPAPDSGGDRAPSGYQPAVIGGADAPATWTFMAALIAPGAPDDFYGQFCGGALIAPTWVLTAAHCAVLVEDEPESLRVLIGRRNLYGTDGDDITARSIHLHPGYDHEDLGSPDVALIELSEASSQGRIPLMSASDEPVWNDTDHFGVVAGWGRLTPSGNAFPTRLQSANLLIWSDAYCDLFYLSYRSARHLCAGSSIGSACVGDSGGPLLALDEAGRTVITGVVSYGAEYCTAAPGVFSQVSHFRSWIDGKTGSSSPPTSTTTTAPPSTTTSTTTPSAPSTPAVDASGDDGYWMLQGDGGVVTFGDAAFHGSYPNTCWSAALDCGMAVDLEPTPSGAGYWTINRYGDIVSFGDAATFDDGLPGGHALGLRATSSGNGAWIFDGAGCIATRGDAPHLGSACGQQLTGGVIGMTPTPTGRGYWLLGSDGGIFTFGDAAFHGSTGALTLNKPIVAMATTRTGRGYWLVASDGGIFTFGDARFYGSAGNLALNKPIIGILPSRGGNGYHLVAADGGMFSFGRAAFHGSLGGSAPPSGVVDAAVIP